MSEKTDLDKFEEVCERIEQGSSLNQLINGKNAVMTNNVFYRMLNEVEGCNERYARARKIYADLMFEEIKEISDHSDQDHTPFTGSNVIQRDRLRIDARKWILSKLEPKKYGDKLDIDHTTKGESINVISLGGGIKPDEAST